MKHLSRYIIVALCLCMPLMGSAQKKRPTTKKPVVEAPPVDPKLERMVMNTQKIIFIDSLLVPRSDMLSKITFTPQTGVLKAEQQGYSYQNEIGTRRIFAKEGKLYESMKAGNSFVNEQELKGLITPGEIDSLDHPFLMNDGTTLYFSAKGSESIGGYDIFVTRYDSESHSFLKPENIGMPFNSKADDILFIIDEESRIGYFATSRRQPAGYVCIYSFIPNDVRQSYGDQYAGRLKSLADIERIADTWGDGHERTEALKRMEKAQQHSPLNAQPSTLTPFVINDNTIYTSPADFKAMGNAERYQQLLIMRNQLETLRKELQSARIQYANATASQRESLGNEILTAEKNVSQLETNILLMEQDIRNSENQLIQ